MLRTILWFVVGFIFIMALAYGQELFMVALGPLFAALKLGADEKRRAEEALQQRQKTVDAKLEELSVVNPSVAETKRQEVEEWLDR